MSDKKRIYTFSSLYGENAEAHKRSYYKATPEKIFETENAVILPLIKKIGGQSFFQGGIVDCKGSFFEPAAHIHSFENEIGSLKNAYAFEEKNVISDDRTVIYGGILFDHFGHFLTESTTRLWYAVKYAEQKYPIVFLKEKERFPVSQILEFFELSGLLDRLVFISQPTRFAKIIVPVAASVLACSYDDRFMSLYQAVAKSVEARSYDKIYLSRRKFKGGIKIIGEDRLEKTFKANGYKVVYPECLKLKEQIAYVKGAKAIASVMGTASHLALFAGRGTKSIVFERTEHINQEQILINQANGLDWYSVNANMNYLPVGHEFSPILLGITDNVVDFLKDSGYVFEQSDVNKISDRAVRAFNRAWFVRYSSDKYNSLITGLGPVFAGRIKTYCQTAFLSLRQRLFMKRSNGAFRVYTVFGFSFKIKRKI